MTPEQHKWYWKGFNDAKAQTAVTESYKQSTTCGEPVAWLITDEKINSLQVDSIQRLIDRARHAHMTDIKLRINGQDEWYQADWLKHLTPPPVTESHKRKPYGYAGITIWGGDTAVTKVFTETEMKFAREPRSLIESVFGQCLDELAAHGIKE